MPTLQVPSPDAVPRELSNPNEARQPAPCRLAPPPSRLTPPPKEASLEPSSPAMPKLSWVSRDDASVVSKEGTTPVRPPSLVQRTG
ncbi:hypothetical protein C2845_PM14G04220 [Panicum miliaceum]|uniref:Uncharacterized protein n=1 Tax=Panicum miliaceum TaxID=4540 RepID=A0A3L6PSM9_PANMI|nr:hypothetical protein C2845_PM14G04220 [Panicum miliaceum]